MYVLHRILDHSPELLEPLVWPQGGDSVPLHHDVTLGEQLDGLEGGPVGSNQSLSASHKPVLVPHKGLDLDDVTSDIILQNPYSLHDPKYVLGKGSANKQNQFVAIKLAKFRAV